MNSKKMKNLQMYNNAVGGLFILLVAAMLSSATIAKAEKVVDLGQLEIEGELRRPNVQWVDSNKKIKEYIVRIYTEQFRRLEDELLKPMTKPQFRAELQKEERLVSN